MLHTIVDGIMLLQLVLLGMFDLKKKQLPGASLVLMSICAVVFQMSVLKDGYLSVLFGLGIGLGWLFISRVTGEAVGYGDSWLMVILGIYLGGRRLLFVILASTFGACAFAILYCMKYGWNRKRTIPFVPFLAAAYLGVVYL